MDGAWLDQLALLIRESSWLAPFLAFAAGVLTSFTPCSLTAVPLVIGYVGGSGENNSSRDFRLSLVFVLGSAVTYTVLGVIAATAGSLMGSGASWWYLVLGTLMLMMALQTWGIFEFIPSAALIARNTKKGALGALIAGILAGIFSSPCSTPVLIALLAIVAGKGSLLWGALLLLLYSAGHGVLAVAAGTSVGFVQMLAGSERYRAFGKGLKLVLGAVILMIGLYMFWLGF